MAHPKDGKFSGYLEFYIMGLISCWGKRMPTPEIGPEVAKYSGDALNLYEADFYAWTQEQARLLRSQQFSRIDWPNLIEEVESLGKQQRQELRNRLSVLVGHLAPLPEIESLVLEVLDDISRS